MNLVFDKIILCKAYRNIFPYLDFTSKNKICNKNSISTVKELKQEIKWGNNTSKPYSNKMSI